MPAPLRAGLCLTDIDNFCKSVRPGELRLALCLGNQLAEEEKGNVQGGLRCTACV